MNVLLLRQWLSENSPALLGLRLCDVQQVDAKTLALHLAGAQSCRLMLSIRETYPALFSLPESPSNKAAESGFAKALRFHLAGATVVSIGQEGFDRSVSFCFKRKDIYGRETERTLRVELVGRASNAYLLAEHSMVVSIFKHVPAGRNSVRRVVTGKPLPPPPPLGKLIARELDTAALQHELDLLAMQADDPVRELLTRRIAGGEVGLWLRLQELLPQQPDAAILLDFIRKLQRGDFNSSLFGIADSANSAVINFWNATAQSSPNAAKQSSTVPSQRNIQLAAQLELAWRADQLEALALEMLQRNFIEREKEAAYLKGWQLAHSEWSERIDLTKSAEENAGALIEYAQRLKRARPKLEALLANETVPRDPAGPIPDSAEGSPSRSAIDPLQRDLARLERHGVKYLRYITSDGIALLVGQSDRSNDELVRHYGSSRHLWLHVRDYPGSHVLLLTNGRDVPPRSLEEAAIVAGYYSQGRGETDLDVSYTPVKQLRRPKGGKPGQVLKLSERVLRVNPMRFEQLRDSLRVSASAP